MLIFKITSLQVVSFFQIPNRLYENAGTGRTDAEAPVLWPLMQRADSLEKSLVLERLKAGGEGMTEDEMVGWHHRLDGHDFHQAPGVADGQGSLA